MPPRLLLAGLSLSLAVLSPAQTPVPTQNLLGFRDAAAQARVDRDFMAVPDARLAGEALKALTAAPHIAGSKEDYATALYVAEKFRAAGLETKITPYRVWLNLPGRVSLEARDGAGKVLMTGPTPEHVEGDRFEDDPRVTPGFNGSSASGDVTAPVVYANYGRPEDFDHLDALGIGVRGKIVLVRYGSNFRGVKAFIAEQRGAKAVLIYSDPADDGYYRGEAYPKGPYRPDTGIQRGSIQYMFEYPGDVTTPGIASTADLPDSSRTPPERAASMPKIMATPISYHDAAPILGGLGGPEVPRPWQGALPFNYHVGGQGVTVHLVLQQNYSLTTIWDVTGNIDPDPASREDKNSWVVAGNHRDAWVYGAVDPNSGTAAMLEAVHGVGALLKQGWKPKRRILFCSWDAEEEGLIGSTEWAEEKAEHLGGAVAYFNTDVGVSGPNFDAAAVPSLKEFVRSVAREVPSPKGGTVYDQWVKAQAAGEGRRGANNGFNEQRPANSATAAKAEAKIGDLGSGSDYSAFIQHLGVPSTDVGSDGPYGVYHSVFDNYQWFVQNADPTFVYEQQQARVFGLEILHMADADVLPYDYVTYAQEIGDYLEAAKKKAAEAGLSLDVKAAESAAREMVSAAEAVHARQVALPASAADDAAFNLKLRQVEADLLSPEGLPHRPWYKHTIYAPGEYTGYAAVVIPGVNEALDAKDGVRAQAQLGVVTAALQRATATLQAAAR
ncbi:MAG TPA: transferrin receptor-like dimerization domain-containing protein [Acidobacteriaceae bacterium]